jgi:ankyrin repeat protein
VQELKGAMGKGLVDLNEKDEFGATALQYAISYKNLEVIALLLEHGADVAVQHNDGSTALHIAVESKLPQVADELLKRNPGLVAIADKHGNQPLWTAAFNPKGDYELVLLLLRYGADPEHRNNVNLTPIDSAKRSSDDTLLQLLESKGETQKRTSKRVKGIQKDANG